MKENLSKVNLELTSRCNYACTSCPTDGLIRGKGSMDERLYQKIFDEVGNKLERVFLWGYGEPLLHPQVGDFIRYASKFSAKKVMSTTGWRFEDLWDLESLTLLDELIASINGITPEVYSQHQVNGDLEKVIRGIKRVSPLLKNSETRFIMQAVAHKGNLHEIPQMEEFAREYGFDMLVIKSFNVMDGKQETFDGFVPLGTKFSRYDKGLDSAPEEPESGIYPCEEGMVINWDGSVNPCCWDYKGKHVLGNVSEKGVYGVWNDLKSQSHRESIGQKKFIDICVDCSNSKTVSLCNLTHKGDDDVKKSI